MRFGILRGDGKWYCGTADKEPVWSTTLSASGVFYMREFAQKRADALRHNEGENEQQNEVLELVER